VFTDARVEAIVPSSDLSRSRGFYEGVLGLSPVDSHSADVDVLYALAGGTRLLVEEMAGPDPWPRRAHTAAHFVVDDVAGTVRELRGRGVEFQEHDLPRLKTVDGVAHVGDHDFAWFTDPDGNVLGIHD
jgi:catechol 2,3-dioxygenase-like lactoylglutathione lyase family enzyme